MSNTTKVAKIKICHVINGFENGGAEAVIYNYMTHMDCNSFEFHFIAHEIRVKECVERFKSLGCKIHEISSKKNPIKHVCEMYKVLKDEKFDIIHIATTEWAFIAASLGMLTGCKVRISHSHMAEYPETKFGKIVFGIKVKLGRFFANEYWACGEDAGFVLFGKKAFDEGKVTVFNNAIDIKKYAYSPEKRSKLRNKLGIQKDTLVIGHVGRFTGQKNHSFLIDVFNELINMRSDSKLLLIGDGPLRDEIEEKVCRLGLNDKVIFMGVRDDAYDYYQAMDNLVMPSIMEGLPLVGVEAQVAGLRVVFSSVVTKKVDIAEQCYFLDLDQSSTVWAKTIDEISMYERKTFYCEDYDINIQAKKMEQAYVRLSTEKVSL